MRRWAAIIPGSRDLTLAVAGRSGRWSAAAIERPRKPGDSFSRGVTSHQMGTQQAGAHQFRRNPPHRCRGSQIPAFPLPSGSFGRAHERLDSPILGVRARPNPRVETSAISFPRVMDLRNSGRALASSSRAKSDQRLVGLCCRSQVLGTAPFSAPTGTPSGCKITPLLLPRSSALAALILASWAYVILRFATLMRRCLRPEMEDRFARQVDDQGRGREASPRPRRVPKAGVLVRGPFVIG
jgi:hypothetical protein